MRKKIKSKVIAISRESILLRLLVFVVVAFLAPVVLHHQALTGPVVNATLFISTLSLGVRFGVLVGVIPSIVAFSVGLLPAPLFPMIPFIMLANIALVFVFNALREKGFWIAVIAASFVKFAFLYSASSLALTEILPQNVSLMMSWPQLITALAGGVIAFFYKKITS